MKVFVKSEENLHDNEKHFIDTEELGEALGCTCYISTQIEEVLQEYVLDDTKYQRVCQLLLQEMENGLENKPDADLKMFPTFVRSLPDGSESGNFLALDLGGTNFRVLLIKLEGEKTPQMEAKIYPISQEIMLGKGTALFDHISECIAKFLEEYKLDKKDHLPLGFTFSFPCKQVGLNVGVLTQWTKGFKCEGVEGEDVVKLLHGAIDRREDLDVECVAILNDTVGCLMSCAFKDHNTELGVILGTGTNACYMERIDRIGAMKGDTEQPRQMIINTEWGAFGNHGCLDFIRTDIDQQIDKDSINPGVQIYEKMISGMYMGELARRIIVKCTEQTLLFEGKLSIKMATPGKFPTKYISEIERDSDSNSFANTMQVLDEMGLEDVSIEDCKNVQYICSTVSTRAANLVSCGIATLVNRIDKKSVTVAVDGSLYRFHPFFHQRLMEKTRQLAKPELEFKLELSEDGSGKGAALVAAVAYRLGQTGTSQLLPNGITN